jgi:hypothetical protein
MTTKLIDISSFNKIKVFTGISLVVKQGPNYEVRIETGENLISNIETKKEGDLVIFKDNSTCNWTRDYKAATVYVTAPNIEEIYSQTEQNIYTDGEVTFPIFRLYAIDLNEGAGSGDFYVKVNNGQLVIESNNVSNFYITGNTNEFLPNLYFGDGRIYAENLEAKKVKVFHRGSNDIFLKPIEEISGTIYNSGNVILKNNPPIINVNAVFTGRLILN